MKKDFLSRDTRFKIFLFSEVFFIAIVAFVVGSFVFSFTHDVFWKLYTYLIHLIIIVGVIMLQLYNYLYFISGMIISFIVMAILLLYKLNTYDNLGFRSFIKSNFVTYLLIWMLFMVSFLTIFASIEKYITSRYIKHNVQPPIGLKGLVGNRGEKGVSYQLDPYSTDGEAQYVYNSICDHADAYYILWKQRRYKKLERELKSIPPSLIFNPNEPQLNNIELLSIFKRICYSREFKIKINDFTNIIIDNESDCIEIDKTPYKYKEMEDMLNDNKYKFNNKELLETILNKPFKILDNYYIELELYENKPDYIVLENKYKEKTYVKTIKLTSGSYIYNTKKCTKGLCKPPPYINIYDLIVQDMGTSNFSVIINIKRNMINFINIRNLALDYITNYMKIFAMNWIDLILENSKGSKFLSEFILTKDLIRNTLDILNNNSIYMILFIKNKHGLQSIYPITDMYTSLEELTKEGYIQTGYMLLRDIDLEIEINNKREKYSFVKSIDASFSKILNKPVAKNLNPLYSVVLNNGIQHIDKNIPIKSITILSVNNKISPWKWGEEKLCLSENQLSMKCKQ